MILEMQQSHSIAVNLVSMAAKQKVSTYDQLWQHRHELFISSVISKLQ